MSDQLSHTEKWDLRTEGEIRADRRGDTDDVHPDDPELAVLLRRPPDAATDS